MTALRRLGIEADFRELVRAAHTSPAIGTPPDLLCQALADQHGMRARVLYPDRLEDLPAGECLLVTHLDSWTDHYVVLFHFDRCRVEVGDPLRGRVHVPRLEFERRWRHLAISLEPGNLTQTVRDFRIW